MKKKILLIVSILLLWGCQPTTPTKTLKEQVTLSLFYLETCAQCKAFKKDAIPYLEKMYGDSLIIQQYDLDDTTKNQVRYDQIIDSLQDFDEELYGKSPFYVVEGYFAKLGYVSGDEEELAKDIEKAVNHQELGYELESLRFLYKED